MNVLFLAFNRPGLTKEVLAVISRSNPRRLYVVADGPRQEHPGDIRKCENVRRIIDQMTAGLNIQKLYREKNLGPRNSIIDAINWFFSHESEGIILEDDCLPHISFFRYCQELLCKYRQNERIYMICGSNFIPEYKARSSYLFSRLALIWGWCTWRRAWENFDPDMQKWPEYARTDDLKYFGEKRSLVMKLIEEQYHNPDRRTWGVVWRSVFLMNRGLSISPKSNLVKNIGFGHPDATRHSQYHRIAEVPVKAMAFPLVHPKEISPDSTFDKESLDFYYGRQV